MAIVSQFDPVSHEPVDPETSNDSSVYHSHRYYFANSVNKQVFDEDPMLWISVPHASQSSASIVPGEDDL